MLGCTKLEPGIKMIGSLRELGDYKVEIHVNEVNWCHFKNKYLLMFQNVLYTLTIFIKKYENRYPKKNFKTIIINLLSQLKKRYRLAPEMNTSS